MLKATDLLQLALNNPNPLKAAFQQGVGAHQELQTKS